MEQDIQVKVGHLVGLVLEYLFQCDSSGTQSLATR